MKYLIILALLLQGCDASNVITADQWKEAENICSGSGGVEVVHRYFGQSLADIKCNNGSVFHEQKLSTTRYL